MDSVIKKKGSFSVLGVQSRINKGSETSELFARIWERFESYGEIIESLSTGKQYFGVNFPTPNEEVTDYMAGMMVGEDTFVPDGLVKRTVQGGDYAVFTCPVEEIGKCYLLIFTGWLPAAQVMFNSKNPVFEEYPEKNSSGPVRIHIPVLKQEK